MKTVGLSLVDITIVGIALILGIKGFIYGFTRAFASFFGLAAGLFAAARLSHDAATLIDRYLLSLQNKALLEMLGFMSILGAVWLGCVILAAIFVHYRAELSLTPLSRILGWLSTTLKYLLVAALLVVLAEHFEFLHAKLQRLTQKSLLYPYLRKSIAILSPQLLSDERAHINTPIAVSSDGNRTKTESSP